MNSALQVRIARIAVRLGYTIATSLFLWLPIAYVIAWLAKPFPIIVIALSLYLYPSCLGLAWTIFRNYESIPKEPLEE